MAPSGAVFFALPEDKKTAPAGAVGGASGTVTFLLALVAVDALGERANQAAFGWR